MATTSTNKQSLEQFAGFLLRPNNTMLGETSFIAPVQRATSAFKETRFGFFKMIPETIFDKFYGVGEFKARVLEHVCTDK